MKEWTVSGQYLTEEAIRDYSLRNKCNALSYDKLRVIAMDYLNKVLRKTPKFDKWPKDIKNICSSKGITQDPETGLPTSCEGMETAWNARALVAEEDNQNLQDSINLLKQTQQSILDYIQKLHSAENVAENTHTSAVVLQKVHTMVEEKMYGGF